MPLFADRPVNPGDQGLSGESNPPQNDPSPPHKLISPPHKAVIERSELPEDLDRSIARLGARSAPDDVQRVILALCRWQPLSAAQIATLIGRTQRNLNQRYLKPLLQQGLLEYTHPNNPAHPQQAYRTKG
jgi:ATP-dependent DNA helicase RecG